MNRLRDISKNTAFKFVILMGLTSLFADVTYEGARSITGPYLAQLGSNAAIVGFVAGFGEMVGYGLRFFSGYLADKTGRYWTITIIGYFINLSAAPLLALAGHWQIAAALIIMERAGKAIRVPSRDAMLSHAAEKMGAGRAFGIHEALDKTGACLGPLLIALILYLKEGYQFGFALLAIPALMSFSILLFARYLYPKPENLESKSVKLQAKGMNDSFWIYVIAAAFVAAGYADFPLMAYHFVKKSVLPEVWVPIAYAIAMGLSALTAYIFGRLYDRIGFSILIIITLVTSFFAPFAFLGGFGFAIFGVCLWSVGMGAHESIMRAVVANMIPSKKRGTAYGMFNMIYGIAWFLGSFLMGILYDSSIPLLIVFSVGIQLASIPLLWVVMKKLDQVK